MTEEGDVVVVLTVEVWPGFVVTRGWVKAVATVSVEDFAGCEGL